VHRFCSKACETEAGVYPGKQSEAKQTTHMGMHGADGPTNEQDPAAALMLAAGVIPMGDLDSCPISFSAWCFTAKSNPLPCLHCRSEKGKS